jgi:hypothetical protein
VLLRLLWRAGYNARWHNRQVYSVSSDTLVQLASGLSGHCVKKLYGLVGSCFGGRTALELRLSWIRTGVIAMGQDCNYQLCTIKLGRGKKRANTPTPLPNRYSWCIGKKQFRHFANWQDVSHSTF